MTQKYQSYPEYQNSGVKWFGSVPKEWLSSRLKFESSINMGQSPSSDDCNQEGLGIPFLQGNAEFGVKSPSPKQYCEVSRKIADKGDFLFSVRAPVGALNLADQEYGIGRGLCAITNNESLSPEFLWWLIPVVRSELDSVSTGSTFEAVSAEQVENVVIFKPPKLEQLKIADFLDHETAKIDTLIEKQQQLIKLLKEKRQAVISHAVTKGLNTDVPMRDSGVEWLGEVPEHWEVTRLKYECSHIVDCPHSTPEYSEDGIYPSIRTADISVGSMDVDNSRRVTQEVYNSRNLRLVPEPKDIIYSREGERFGIAALIPQGAHVCLAQRVMLFRIKGTPEFLMWAINSQSTYKQAQQVVIGSTSPHVNVDTIKNFALAWPPESERKQISSYIDEVTVSMENIINIAISKIALLQERRTALISAAVTGKIDVRNWSAPNA